MSEQVKQRDYQYRLRYAKLGGHIHCRLFSRRPGSGTWAKVGDIVLQEEEWEAWLRTYDGEVIPE